MVQKAGPIKDVRIPLGKEDNKPKGFAYLEMEDHITYEVFELFKALSTLSLSIVLFVL